MEIDSPSGTPEPSTQDGFLSPNAKIAQMLADIDRQFDGDSTPSPKGHSASSLSPVRQTGSPTTSHPSLPPTSAPEQPSKDVSQSASDDSEEEMLRPQGRAARRMFSSCLNAQHLESSPPVPDVQQSAATADLEKEDLYNSTPVKSGQPALQPPLSPLGYQSEEGLFVSPAKARVEEESDDDLPSHVLGDNDRQRKRIVRKQNAKRRAREAEERRHKSTSSPVHDSSDLPQGDIQGVHQEAAELDVERIMSDATRPTRKASKKALLEMERETQRLARQQALAHQTKTKKKFTTTDLFARFNFRQQKQPEPQPVNSAAQTSAGYTTASSAPNSDGIEEGANHPVSTPPSSPPTPLDKQKALVDYGALNKIQPVQQHSLTMLAEVDLEEDLPDMADILSSSQARKPLQAASVSDQTVQAPQERKGLKLARLSKKVMELSHDSSDDDGLEIIDKLPSHLRVFERARGSTRAGRPAESKALHNLKHLSNTHAHDGPSKKKGGRPSLNPTVLEAQLRRRAKEQARRQQLERIEELKAKGIQIQTVEERDKEAEEIESLLEKARMQAVELRKAEKAAAAEEGDEGAMLASDDEDEDYDGSGSESEGDEDEEGAANAVIDDVAEEEDEEEDEEDSDEETAAEDEEAPEAEKDVESHIEPSIGDEEDREENTSKVRVSRRHRIIDDDDEDEVEEPAAESTELAAPEAAAAGADDDSDDDPFAAFDFGAGDNAAPLLSPTQAFHATMRTPTQATQEDSLDVFRRIAPLPHSSLPPTATQSEEEESLTNNFTGSQVPESQRIDLNWETQAPETPVPAGLKRDYSALSETPGWEPTQDNGLPSPWTIGPMGRRGSLSESVVEHETQSTVQLRINESPAPSQNMPKRGRLSRRRAVADDSSDDEITTFDSKEKKNAFREMAKKRREALSAAERLEADKEMRQMMDEQAEESEDEYAGLGGDDYIAPENEQDKAMIDSSHVEVDAHALAAHFAERERLREEEETSRLYKDLTTGVLRRKMGANAFDLDEDEDELALRRRQLRQREEAKKRRALLKDENIATLAEGRQSKGKDAFLKAIADDDGDDDMVNLSDDDEERSVPTTQDGSEQSQTKEGPLRETNGNKRRLNEAEDTASNRPPAKQRRTQLSAFKRPTSLLEVQESVSFLLEDQNGAFGPALADLLSASESESENDEDNTTHSEDDAAAIEEESRRENHGGYAPDRTTTIPPPSRLPASQRRTPAAVVDRLSLKRINSASSSDSAHSRTAWASGPSTGGFKVPSLLRRATTSAAAANSNDRGVTTSNDGATLSRENSSGVRMGGSKKSSLAYQARAEERRAIVEAGARRKEESTRRFAEMRRTASAAGVLGRQTFGGRFE